MSQKTLGQWSDSPNSIGPLKVWQTSQLPIRARSALRSQDQNAAIGDPLALSQKYFHG